jgi:serine/threonine protein kinase
VAQSLTKGITSQKSDVWSMGIVLYEIHAMGGTPYVVIFSFEYR